MTSAVCVCVWSHEEVESGDMQVYAQLCFSTDAY